MKQKIEWYQEVLELEPGSKVFFPLAKMLVADGRTDDAIAALRRGVDRHPEFIEARLFLVELLHKNGQDEPRNVEAANLAKLFSAYPAFWAAWGAVSMADENGPQGTALLLLAAAMREQNISWNDIIASGVRSLMGAAGQGATPRMAAETPFVQDVLTESLLSADEAPEVAVLPLAPLAPLAEGGEDAPEDTAGDEHLSVRTRSMAEVLVEQGDLRGAKEIYEELLHASKNRAITADLRRRIEELDERMSVTAGAARQEDGALDASGSVASGKDRIVNMLQLLAGRLENRAR